MNKITVLILHYKRPQNIPRIMAGITKQTIPADVWIWDSSGDCPDCGANVVIRSSKNFACQPRLSMSGLVQTPYIFNQDDDFALRDHTLFERLIALSETMPDTYIGHRGKIFDTGSDKEKPYQCGGWWCGEGPCDMVNTGLSFYPTGLINRVPQNPFYSDRPVTDIEFKYGDDMWISAYQKCYAYPIDMSVDRLEEGTEALSKTSIHMDIRNRITLRYWGHKING